MTMEERLVAECQRLDAMFTSDADAGLTREELIARFIARKMQRLQVSDAEIRDNVTAMLRRRYGDMTGCCVKVE